MTERPWVSEWMAALEASQGEKSRSGAARLVDSASRAGLRIARQGEKDPGVAIVVPNVGWDATPVIIKSNGQTGWELGDIREIDLHSTYRPWRISFVSASHR